MPILINEINNFIKTYLSSDTIKDIAINGIQLENDTDIKKIAFTVDLSNDSINSAIEKKCNLIIVHHGIFWGSPLPITGTFKNRIKLLLDKNIGLIAQHLPLDMHPEIGNNAQILKLLDANELLPFGMEKGCFYGYKTEFPRGLTIEQINNKLNIKNKIYLDFGNKSIKKTAVVSGSGSKFLNEAINDNIDLFITGDSEHIVYHAAKESGINVLFAGHYYTETFGIKALMGLIEKNFKVETFFIDIPTGL